MANKKWTGPNGIVAKAREIVNGYDVAVTLRQVHYRLVAVGFGGYANTESCYKQLSSETTAARRDRFYDDGTEERFPELVDQTRRIHRPSCWSSPDELLDVAIGQYRIDRLAAQPWTVVLGIEKRTMLSQMTDWFEDRGFPIVPLGGYSSEPFERETMRLLEERSRPSVLLYAGDFDPSGYDILRNFEKQIGRFDKVVHLAVTPEQVERYDLPLNPGKASDSRAAAFAQRFGGLYQVELEAMDPLLVRDLYEDAISLFWDQDAYDLAVSMEDADVDRMLRFKDLWATWDESN